MRYYFIPLKINKIQNTDNTLSRMWSNRNSFTASRNGKWYSNFRRQVGWFLTKLNILTIHSYSLAVSYINKTWHAFTKWSNNHDLWYWPKWTENSGPCKSLHKMSVIALFLRAPTGKQLRYSSIAWVDK